MKYLKDQTWAEVTREERYFCAELFFELKKDNKPFLKLIGKDNGKNYDVGFEACFYRDVLIANDKSARSEGLPQKRTFDLLLMSEDEIIIIEAKAYQGFDTKQLSSFQKEKDRIKKLFKILKKPAPDISIIAIHSAKYHPSEDTKNYFSKLITWDQITEIYISRQAIFKRANDIYE